MKKIKKTENNPIITIVFLFLVCIIILTSAYFLYREPESEFIPASTETVTGTETWVENTNEEIILPDSSTENNSQITGSEYDNTQEIISENESETVTSLSESYDKENTSTSKPVEKPETKDDKTNPEKHPEYDSSVPQTSSSDDTASSAPSTESSLESRPGQVYDPVFGWISVGNTNQDAIDSDGDISKQVGTMN